MKIRALVVDDSALVRKTVRELLEAEGDVEVVGVAVNGEDALRLVAELMPDVVSLDLHMPVMDGMTCLGELIHRHRQPVVVLSTLAEENAFATFKALAIGAVDFVTKPGTGAYLSNLRELGEELRAKVRTAARVPRSRIGRKVPGPRGPRPRLTVVKSPAGRPSPPRGGPPPRDRAGERGLEERRVPRLQAVAGIGGSTGATVALEALLAGLPADLPGAVVVVQHMPQGFERHLARYLDAVTCVPVRIPVNGEPVRPGVAYLAPGGVHLRVQRRGVRSRPGEDSQLVFRTDLGVPSEKGFRPAINALLYSLAIAERHRALAVLLSGMGDDGVEGLRAVRRLGGRTLVQDRESSVVFGMAARAIELGAADRGLPIQELSEQLTAALCGMPTLRPPALPPRPTLVGNTVNTVPSLGGFS